MTSRTVPLTGDGRGEQAGQRKAAEDLGNRPDQHRRVEPNGDDLPLVRQEVLVDASRYRFVRYDPNAHW